MYSFPVIKVSIFDTKKSEIWSLDAKKRVNKVEKYPDYEGAAVGREGQ